MPLGSVATVRNRKKKKVPHQNIVTPTVFARYKYLSAQYRSTVVGIGAFYKGKKRYH